jgi:two-component system, OmpR family, response regulator
MSAVTIVFAREDLSIPGTAEMPQPDVESHFFTLVHDSNPDVIVLDVGGNPAAGVATILKIRRRCRVPILVVCDLGDPAVRELRIAGAVECIPAPIDILLLNEMLQQIIKVTRKDSLPRTVVPDEFAFAGLLFYPHRDLLAARHGATQSLTTSESRLLLHFVSHPWRLCPRAELAELLYGSDRVASDRAIDVVINRLRRKLIVLGGAVGQTLIKTEFRRGYLLVARVATTAARRLATDAAA